MRIVCISDTHNRHDALRVPDGDLLVHAGDMSGQGSPDEVRAFAAFLTSLPHRDKVVIAGNHDFLFEQRPQTAQGLLAGSCTYLEDAEATVGGLRIWGSPWQPWFYDWAFNLRRGRAIRAKWELIPDGIDVLVTHGPPAGHGDRTARGEAVGCEDLRDAIARVRPRLHVFGHIHEAYGVTTDEHTTYVNACSCNLAYRPVHAPVVLDWDDGAVRLVAGG